MDPIFLIGSTAAVLTTFAFVPQLIKAAKSKKTGDLSLLMYVLFSLGVSLWMVYGILLGEAPIIIANALSLIMGLYLVCLKVKYS